MMLSLTESKSWSELLFRDDAAFHLSILFTPPEFPVDASRTSNTLCTHVRRCTRIERAFFWRGKKNTVILHCANRHGADSCHETICARCHASELVGHSLDTDFACSGSGGNPLEFSSSRENCFQRAGGLVDIANFRHLSRPTAPRNSPEITGGRMADARRGHSFAQSQQHLAGIAQPSSQSQLQAARITHRIVSDHDER